MPKLFVGQVSNFFRLRLPKMVDAMMHPIENIGWWRLQTRVLSTAIAHPVFIMQRINGKEEPNGASAPTGPKQLGDPAKINKTPSPALDQLPMSSLAAGGPMPSLTTSHIERKAQSIRGTQPPMREKQDWATWTRVTIVQPLRVEFPTEAEHLIEIITFAKSNKLKVKAIGSGHTFSDVSATTDLLVKTHGLGKTLFVEEADLVQRDAIRPEKARAMKLVHVEAGIRIVALNDMLNEHGLALINMGSYDAQTIIGAISTSTHGTGVTLPPFPDLVRSIELITENGELLRIEPTDGLTDPARFQTVYHGRFPSRLIQNDDFFYSSVAAMGTLGIVYSVILEVREKYFLREVREATTWEEVRIKLLQDDFRRHRHYDLILNPYPRSDGRHTVIQTTRNETAPDVTKPDGSRNYLEAVIGVIPNVYRILDWVFELLPHETPKIIDLSMNELIESGYTNLSYKVFNLGGVNHVSSESAEICLPIERTVEAIDEIIRIAAMEQKIGNVFHTAPIGIRFTAPSKHYLSMMYDRETCTIEMPIIRGTFGWREILRRFERSMYPLEGRPHWGQYHEIAGLKLIGEMYPKFDAFLSVYKALNKFNLFENSFTNRCGLSTVQYGASLPPQPPPH